MARKTGTSIQNRFIRGLITEATALSFPEDGCTETNNVVFDPTGRVTRRKGFDTEASFASHAAGVTAGQVYTSFIWEAVAGNGNISFLVLQEGNSIKFYDVSESTSVSTNQHSTELSLDDYLATNSDRLPREYLCQFAAGRGDLLIVNAACDPVLVMYDPAADDFTATALTLQYRDFAGLDDGLAIDARPTATVAGIETSNPSHYYNLLNQGWDDTDALSQWDTARTDLPSNADYVALYRASETDAFDNARVDANTPANRPAPKGHFILDVGRDNRQEVLTAAGYTFDLTVDSESLVDPSSGTVIGDINGNPSRAFDGSIGAYSNAAVKGTNVADCYIGKTFSSGVPIAKATVYATTTDGFMNSGASPNTLTITLYGKTGAAPANATDGTALGNTGSFTDANSLVKTIFSNDTATAWDHVWVYMNPDDASVFELFFSEVQFYTPELTFERPSCTEFYSGRAFYGGINEGELANNIYFTQIIESDEQYGYCYQKNDPTNEHIPDLLADDGGVIKIPEMGTLKKLYAYQTALLAYANNGIWLISGSSGSNFKADDYQVKKISSIGIVSADSLISIKGLPAWWGEDGIYTVKFDANYDSFTPVSLTSESIDRLYRAIPSSNKQYVKGCYDETEQVAYWIYSADEDLPSDVYRYDSVLCLDGKSQAFYTWEIGAGPLVRTIDYVKPADRSVEGIIKLMIHRSYNGSTASQTFAEIQNTNYIDWEEEGTGTDYESTFVTGYKLDGETQRFFQSNYVFVFLETEENASCFMQGVFDFTTSSAEGKWSTRQQIYNENLTNRGVNFRRLKVRGKGRALQLKFESESQKPFTIIGWSIWETSNSGI